MRQYLNRQQIEPLITAHIDERNERYIVQIQNDIRRALVYSLRGGRESVYVVDPIALGNSENGRVYWVSEDRYIYEAYEGDTLGLFRKARRSELSFVVNSYPNVTKVFQAIKMNCSDRVDEIKCEVYNESGVIQTTGWIGVNKPPENHQYYFNRLRWKDNGKSKKLRGQFMVVSIRFTGTQDSILTSIITSMRKSH